MLILAVVLSLQAEEIKHPWHGEFKDDYKDPKTKALVMHYRMRVPDKLPEQKHLGLIVAFHGMNGNEDHMTGFAINAAKSAGLADQYLIMGGKSKGAGWATSDDKDLLAWIAWAKETYPIDPRRVHLIGMSNGGWMVKRFGWEHQELFASVTAYCGGGVDFSNPPKNGVPAGKPGTPTAPSEVKTEWYFVHGDADKEVPHDASRRACQQLKEKGYRYVYREIAGADHGGITRFPDVAEDVVRFMHALRHKEIPITAAEKKELAGLVTKVKNEKGDGAAPFIKEAQRLGGAPGARVINAALDASDVDVKKTAASTAGDTLYGREIVMELIKLLKDKSEDVQQAAFEGLATASNWRYEEAQQHLARIAKQKSAGVEDRIAAVRGLGKTVKLQLYGNFEDKLVLWTLVLCLDDDELKVREAAFAQLEKGVKDTFEYKPDMDTAQRKAPMQKWKSWTQTKAGPLEGGARP
ncbi:MAG TPA: prolyl oligopeptidase family serine peptidase [Planctomycetota bacterium]